MQHFRCDFKAFACACVSSGGTGAPQEVPLPSAKCCGVDIALLRHPGGILLPPLHPAL